MSTVLNHMINLLTTIQQIIFFILLFFITFSMFFLYIYLGICCFPLIRSIVWFWWGWGHFKYTILTNLFTYFICLGWIHPHAFHSKYGGHKRCLFCSLEVMGAWLLAFTKFISANQANSLKLEKNKPLKFAFLGDCAILVLDVQCCRLSEMSIPSSFIYKFVCGSRWGRETCPLAEYCSGWSHTLCWETHCPTLCFQRDWRKPGIVGQHC